MCISYFFQMDAVYYIILYEAFIYPAFFFFSFNIALIV
jgi:hypothetical protein